VFFPIDAVREIGARGKAGGVTTRLGLAGLVAGVAGCAWVALAAVPVTNEGDILVDQNGMTLYTFDRDSELKSVCNAQCAASWPPLIAAAGAKRAGRYAIVARDDGRRQWTYKGKPLYLSVQDQRPGDRSGDGVDNLWRIARP
jgi:predicted lipoprotein with Yx(FWY)xxD motif